MFSDQAFQGLVRTSRFSSIGGRDVEPLRKAAQFVMWACPILRAVWGLGCLV